MARTIIFSINVLAALGARIKNSQHQFSTEKSGMFPSESPIPMPEGYKFNLEAVYAPWCYAPLKGSTPIGYSVSKGRECPGEKIETWADGNESSYGSSDFNFADLYECAKTCNKHAECTGFDSMNGICSHWRSGSLQALHMTSNIVPSAFSKYYSSGNDCYVKWEARDLDYKDMPEEPYDFRTPNSIKPSGPQVSDCLCVFDVDRTLTAKQGWHDQCNGTEVQAGVEDCGYEGGDLTLSNLALNIKSSFCGQCYFGAVSAGTACGPNAELRDVLDTLVEPQYNVGDWIDGCPTGVWGTKALCCGEGETKMAAVRDILAWLGTHGVSIADDKVHFFDDKANNVEGFATSPYNAHQISCQSRDGSRGGCGGTASEIVNTVGKFHC